MGPDGTLYISKNGFFLWTLLYKALTLPFSNPASEFLIYKRQILQAADVH